MCAAAPSQPLAQAVVTSAVAGAAGSRPCFAAFYQQIYACPPCVPWPAAAREGGVVAIFQGTWLLTAALRLAPPPALCPVLAAAVSTAYPCSVGDAACYCAWRGTLGYYADNDPTVGCKWVFATDWPTARLCRDK